MSLRVGRVSHRLRSFFLLLVALCALAALHSRDRFKQSRPDQVAQDFSIIQARAHFSPQIYDKWNSGDTGVQSNCRRYWKDLVANVKKGKVQLGLDDGFVFEPRIYKKSKWLIKAKKELRRKLHSEGVRMDDTHLEALEQRYQRDLLATHRKENAFVEHITHLRILGKCMLDQTGPHVESTDSGSRKAIQALIPWLSAEIPNSNRGLLGDVAGQGIVFVVFPNGRNYQQVERIARVLQVLKVQGNELPIQITYFGEDSLKMEWRELLERVATAEATTYSKSYESLESMGQEQIPDKPQQISFKNLEGFVAGVAPIGNNLVFHLAMIFNSFEEVLYISSQAIPMASDLHRLFSIGRYQDSGMYFFKNKASLDYKTDVFPAGFFETNELVNKFSGVKAKESELFGIAEAQDDDTSWYADLGFSRLLDMSMVVLNKRKTMTGLLIGSILPKHGILSPKYNTDGNVNPEFLWLGQKLAGSHATVTFNTYFASIPGVLTPAQKLPQSYLSQEMCSSSWSQLLDEDNSLLYVTSHQLENRVLPSFSAALFEKLAVNATEASENQWIEETVGKNLLYIQSVLQPLGISEALINDEGQPHGSYSSYEDFGSANNFWCAYDVVGSVEMANRGFVVDVGQSSRARYLFYLDMWLEDPRAQ